MVWAQLAMAGLGAFSKYKQGKANEEFAQKQLDLQNKEAREAWNRTNDQRLASAEANRNRLALSMEGSRAMLGARKDAFGQTKLAEEEEQAQREKFSKALVDFGEANKKVNLADAKAKRSGRASKAAKGAKVSGTSGRAGRLSGAFRSGARGAVAAGLDEAATTAGMEASLKGYGADLTREFGMFGDLSSQGAVVGEAAKRRRALAAMRERLGGQEQQAINEQAAAGYSRDMAAAQRLGVQPPRQVFGGTPDYGIWDKVGYAADIGSTYYGMKGYQAPTQGQGITYGSGSPFPNRYVGMPSNPKNYNTHPGY